MANPIAFKPPVVDPRTELNRRLEAAPTEHAEALLVVWDLLQSAHDQGILDALHGLVSAKDTVFSTVAEYAKLPESVSGIRNLVAFAKIVGTLDPEALEKLSKSMVAATQEHAAEEKPPSMWQLFRRASSEDGRRGLSFLTMLLTGLGTSLGADRTARSRLAAPARSSRTAPRRILPSRVEP